MACEHPMLDRGMWVYTTDQARLGVIRDIVGRCMKISPRFGRDYWIPTTTILMVDRRGVLVDFLRKDLERLRLSEPPAPMPV